MTVKKKIKSVHNYFWKRLFKEKSYDSNFKVEILCVLWKIIWLLCFQIEVEHFIQVCKNNFWQRLKLLLSNYKLTARALAESPSVNIKVHFSEFLPPASLASSSFTIPRSLWVFVPSVFLRSLLCLKSAHDKRVSTIPEFATANNATCMCKRPILMVELC